MTDEELDLYFATCGSLSNLPTPPPAKEHATKKLASTTSDQQEFAPKLRATWQETLRPSNYARDLEYFMRTDTCHHACVSPDVLILAALSLAHGYFSDTRRSAHYWAVGMSRNQFTVQELEGTKRAILQDMDYALGRITEGMMDSMLRDMQRTKTPSSTAALANEHDSTAKPSRRRNFSIDLPGTATWKNGVPTPEPSP
ncbi:hypothetical protein G6514_008987 [Epicoccum nigrum]|nr:hypothetical protein G6514_008987 [Epicoccum nigrum]